jgi:hypothetical protein
MNIGLTGKRVKYAKQRDRFSCSPIAIINMMKWLGVPCSVDEYLPMFKEACKTKIKIGSNRKAWTSTAKRVASCFNLDTIWSVDCTTDSLIEKSKEGYVFLITYEYIDHGVRRAHSIFVPYVDNKQVVAINESKKFNTYHAYPHKRFDNSVMEVVIAVRPK